MMKSIEVFIVFLLYLKSLSVKLLVPQLKTALILKEHTSFLFFKCLLFSNNKEWDGLGY